MPDCHKCVTTRRQHTPTAIRRAIKFAVSLSVRSQNNILPKYRGRERSIVCNPLSRGAQAAEVDEVCAQELPPTLRQKWTVRLHHMAIRPNHILRNRVDDDSAAHQSSGDELEDVVVGSRTINRLAFQIEKRLTGSRYAENLTHHRDVLGDAIFEAVRVKPDQAGEHKARRDVEREANVETVERCDEEDRENRKDHDVVAR